MKLHRIVLVLVLVSIVSLSYSQKIGLLMDSYVVDRWRTDQSLITERIKELGGQCMVEVPHGNADEQVRLAKKLIGQGVKALIVVPTDAKRAAEIADAAKAAKIPLISYDRMIASPDVSFYISYDASKVGHMQASYALDKMPKGNFILINGPTTDINSIVFRSGQLEILQKAIDEGRIKIIADFVLEDWSELEAIMKLEEFLSTNTERPDAIVAANDALATGAITVLPADLAGKVVITGQDAERIALKNIVTGVQSMTVYKPIKPLAYQAAEIAIKLAKGQKVESVKVSNAGFEVNAILLDPVVVDKSNLQQTVIKDGHLSMSEIQN